jgi:hypothetical protein
MASVLISLYFIRFRREIKRETAAGAALKKYVIDKRAFLFYSMEKTGKSKDLKKEPDHERDL